MRHLRVLVETRGVLMKVYPGLSLASLGGTVGGSLR